MEKNVFSQFQIANSCLRSVLCDFYPVQYFISIDKKTSKGYALLYKDVTKKDVEALVDFASDSKLLLASGVNVVPYVSTLYCRIFPFYNGQFYLLNSLPLRRKSQTFTQSDYQDVFHRFFNQLDVTRTTMYVQTATRSRLNQIVHSDMFTYRFGCSDFNSLTEYREYVATLPKRDYYIFDYKSFSCVDFNPEDDLYISSFDFALYNRYFVEFNYREDKFYNATYQALPDSATKPSGSVSYIRDFYKGIHNDDFVKQNGSLVPSCLSAYYKRAIPFDYTFPSQADFSRYENSLPISVRKDSNMLDMHLYNAFCAR